MLNALCVMIMEMWEILECWMLYGGFEYGSESVELEIHHRPFLLEISSLNAQRAKGQKRAKTFFCIIYFRIVSSSSLPSSSMRL